MFPVKASQLLLKAQTVRVAKNMSAISGPPQVKISPAEKFAHGVAIAAGVLAIPAWVLVNIKNYRGITNE